MNKTATPSNQLKFNLLEQNMSNCLLIITGSISAYKIPSLCQSLQQQGHSVRVIMTSAATEIITPLTLKSVCKQEVYLNSEVSREQQPMLHIDLAKWANQIIFAPASANTIAKLANGTADDLIGNIYLATNARIFIAPAMNMNMWQHPATQQNIKILLDRKHSIIGPELGLQACGDNGPGRLAEIESILAAINPLSAQKPLTGINILINAGPTREAIDCMRYLSNRSSGKMGYALAEAAAEAGATVTLISGPCEIQPPPNIKLHKITTAIEMLHSCRKHAANNHIFIACAAIADYRPEVTATTKIKKNPDENTLNLKLIKNPDILSSISTEFPTTTCIGFAAESENLRENAIAKLKQKKLAAIIANPIDKASGAESDYQEALLIDQETNCYKLQKQCKKKLAANIIKKLVELNLCLAT